MKTIKLLIELTYDEDMMHSDDPESIEWFYNGILRDEGGEGEGEGLLLHSNEIGDTVGSVRVLRMPEMVERMDQLLADKMRKLDAVQDELEKSTTTYITAKDYWQNRTIKLEEELRAVYQALDDLPFVRPTEMLTLVEAEDVLKRLARWCRDNIELLEKGVKFMKWIRG